MVDLSRLAREFPDYPADSLPTIPAGFVDRSWRNETLPSFIHEESGVVLWCDYPNPLQREWPDAPRFSAVQCVTRDDEAGWQFDGTELPLFETNSAVVAVASLLNFIEKADAS